MLARRRARKGAAMAPLAVASVLVVTLTTAAAAPVGGDTSLAAPDPYELASRWTLASLTPSMPGAGAPLAALQPAGPGMPAAPAAPAPALRLAALPMAGADAGVPDPGAYALMGLALLAAGLAVHQLRRGRRPGRGRQPPL